MDGMEVLAAIKENPALSDIPTIILTATDSVEVVSRAYQCKADYYMIKPQDLDQFTASVKYLEECWLKRLKAAPVQRHAAVRPPLARVAAHRTGMVGPTHKVIRPVTVFMVEENMADIVLILESLKVHSRFIELTMAKDRAETLTYLNRFRTIEKIVPPDVILLDLSLSNRSGLEFLAIIRSVSELDQVPLILLTNADVQRDIRRAYDEPTNFYIKKPHRPDQLFAAIHHVVNSRR
ncbi:MAG TPA: response regulator, partial [bacterium]|nr:response regulator [bacterium]